MEPTRDDVTARQPHASFTLVDHDGRHVTERTYLGRYVLLFFGFTHCEVVCPRALSRLTAVLDRLGTHADRIEPLYVTVDPERDTPDVMKQFLSENYPRFTGLTGTASQIDSVKASFRVFARKVEDPEGTGCYRVPHTAFTYLLGPAGQYLSHFSDAVEQDELVERLLELLS
jgi:protein SCO1/2